MRIVAISDTHSLHNQIKDIPDGDCLVHAGDMTGSLLHQERDLKSLNEWLGTLPHKYKLCVPGNHDETAALDPHRVDKILTNATLLIDNWVELGDVKFYGSPWTPEFMRWYFMRRRGADIAKAWAAIPNDTDVLITHGPPYGVLDGIDEYSPGIGDYVTRHEGCEELRKRVKTLMPQAHVFGHIHEGSGMDRVDGIQFVNAAVTDGSYRVVNPPRVFDVVPRRK